MTASAQSRRPLPRRAAPMALALVLAGCTAQDTQVFRTPDRETPWRDARIVEVVSPLECVAYVRQATKFELRGDAWTWWASARDRYRRGRTPQPGALLVFRKTRKSAGHLAVVTRVVDERTIVASHANWLNRGRIHEHTPIRDISAAGDWSEVRVWYTPGRSWGLRTYSAYGFIYPYPAVANR